jgi:hypothetical protein
MYILRSIMLLMLKPLGDEYKHAGYQAHPRPVYVLIVTASYSQVIIRDLDYKYNK